MVNIVIYTLPATVMPPPVLHFHNFKPDYCFYKPSYLVISEWGLLQNKLLYYHINQTGLHRLLVYASTHICWFVSGILYSIYNERRREFQTDNVKTRKFGLLMLQHGRTERWIVHNFVKQINIFIFIEECNDIYRLVRSPHSQYIPMGLMRRFVFK
ncbi:hypothetical protein CEXT_186521 [Caerostris extrusa]|uniref:Uncharacterized protein n=1 Tax=Caerostris extrusa TaxID=172846 RepID=A0AAV4SJB4_CAEEX|nr:hypothetical protein CEXT_186521 [Caerostris extrusa]